MVYNKSTNEGSVFMDIKKYFIENIEKSFKSKNSKPISVALIGLGPHAKRIYLNYFKKYRINLSLVVELDSNKEVTENYLYENGFKNTKIITLDDKYKDNKHLPSQFANNFACVCDVFKIIYRT